MKMIMIIVGLSLFAVCAYSSFFDTLWFTLGAIWGLVNLFFIRQLLHELLIAKPKKPLKIAFLTLIKFPVLYCLGFGLLNYQNDVPWALLAGFSGVLVLSAQKNLWNIFQPNKKRGLA